MKCTRIQIELHVGRNARQCMQPSRTKKEKKREEKKELDFTKSLQPLV